MKRFFVLALAIVMTASSSAFGVMIFDTQENRENTISARIIPSDPKLPKYDNPTEIDIDDGNLHISFKGAFRHLDKNSKPDKYVVFCFVAHPKKDMEIHVDQSELFDSKARRFKRGKWTPDIGIEATNKREIIADIPIQIRLGFDMPVNASEMLPSIARVSFRFNGQWFQFRNIKAEEWSVWRELRKELGLYEDD